MGTGLGLRLALALAAAAAITQRAPTPVQVKGFWGDVSRVNSLPDPPAPERLARIREQIWRGGLEPALETDRIAVTDIVGCIPEDLSGTICRSGPGRIRVLDSQYGHWFDGDGILSSVSLDGASQSASFALKYVETDRFKAQQRRNAPYPETRGAAPEERPGFGLAGAWTKRSQGKWWQNFGRFPTNPANTAPLFFGQGEGGGKPRLLALCEGGPPVEVDAATLETLGDLTLDGPGAKATSTFSAHYSTDPKTGDIYNHGLILGASASLNVMRLDGEGMELKAQADEPLPYFTFVHDAALSQSHLAYITTPWVIPDGGVLKVITGQAAFGDLYEWRPELGCNIRLHGKGDLKLSHDVSIPTMTLYHLLDAWEDDGAGELRLRCASLDGEREVLEARFADLYRADGKLPLCHIHEYVIDLESGELKSEAPICPDAAPFELPDMNYAWAKGRRRFAYLNARTPEAGWTNGLQKINLETGEASELITFGEETYAAGPLFVARDGAIAEDDGYLLTTVYNALEHRSDVVVLDARSMKVECTLRLDRHVPHGFHGAFCPGAVF